MCARKLIWPGSKLTERGGFGNHSSPPGETDEKKE